MCKKIAGNAVSENLKCCFMKKKKKKSGVTEEWGDLSFTDLCKQFNFITTCTLMAFCVLAYSYSFQVCSNRTHSQSHMKFYGKCFFDFWLSLDFVIIDFYSLRPLVCCCIVCKSRHWTFTFSLFMYWSLGFLVAFLFDT